jgi:activator of HSP90 ATPase
MKTRTTTITQEVIIPAPPAEVYEVLVNPKKHAAMTKAAANGDPKEGGAFTAWDGYIFGEYLGLEKGRKIVWRWSTTEWPEGYPPSKVEITLSPFKGGTKLVMVHSFVPASQAESYRQGWIDFYWKPLREHFR